MTRFTFTDEEMDEMVPEELTVAAQREAETPDTLDTLTPLNLLIAASSLEYHANELDRIYDNPPSNFTEEAIRLTREGAKDRRAIARKIRAAHTQTVPSADAPPFPRWVWNSTDNAWETVNTPDFAELLLKNNYTEQETQVEHSRLLFHAMSNVWALLVYAPDVKTASDLAMREPVYAGMNQTPRP
jgi:hypothetical protein